jgi:hypothetical protein
VQSRNEESAQATAFSFSDTQQALRMQFDLLSTLNSTTKALTDQQTQHNSQFQETMTRVLQSNLQIYQTIIQLQTNLPAQVMRQQPVYLLDAKGFELPFHLEFITSKDVCLIHRAPYRAHMLTYMTGVRFLVNRAFQRVWSK